MKYVIHMKRNDYQRKNDLPNTIYTTENYAFKGDLVIFKDKYGEEIVENTSGIKRIRKVKE